LHDAFDIESGHLSDWLLSDHRFGMRSEPAAIGPDRRQAPGLAVVEPPIEPRRRGLAFDFAFCAAALGRDVFPAGQEFGDFLSLGARHLLGLRFADPARQRLLDATSAG
jgi:hypothetical protein